MSRVVEVTQYGTAATGGRRLKVEVNRAGRQGATGATGPQGPAGPTGPQGPAGTGVTDHGALTGLGDDDHPQYQRADATFTSTDPFTVTDESLVVTTGAAVTLPDAQSNAGRMVSVGAAAGTTTVSAAGSDTIHGAGASTSVAVGNGITFVSVNISGSWGWATINRNGNATALPAWFGQSITQGHVVKMGASAPEWGAAPAPSAHAASHQDGGTDELALDGSQITTGTIGVARLATSGTATAANFLNGSGAWARPTAGWTRVAFNDVDYDISSFAFSCLVVQTGTLTATRTVTLPSTASFSAGQQVVVWSGAGVSTSNRLTIAAVSGQTINGSATFEITQPNRLVRIMSNRNATSATNPNWVVQTADVDAADITTGTVNIARLPTGTTSTTVAVGNDARFSDARTPTAHAASHQDGGTDELALDGSQITTGTVGTARLGSGSATASTFLRGDGSWATPSGTGDVVGPASSVDNRVALFDGTTGKLLKQSAAALASVATSGSASDLSAGTVPTARLGTGTASASTYLRGDQTYARPVVQAYYVAGRYYYTPGVTGGGTRSVASGGATATPYPIYQTVSVDGLQVDLSSATGASQSIDLHVMSANASGDPDASVFTVNVSTTGTGTQVLSATGTPVSLSPGLYYVVVHNRSANALTPRSAAAGCNIPPIPAVTSTSANQLSGWLKSPGTGAITSYPAVTSPTDAVNQSPLVAVRFA